MRICNKTKGTGATKETRNLKYLGNKKKKAAWGHTASPMNKQAIILKNDSLGR